MRNEKTEQLQNYLPQNLDSDLSRTERQAHTGRYTDSKYLRAQLKSINARSIEPFYEQTDIGTICLMAII
jgi:hypothetical protein